ncbi:MAG: hypothetical protein HYT65_00075 [Candidatus Yanofskybacteria bacterium]|nr:hypothetical protein [Candidatus Yanofskybacteria bacterium]
MPKEIPDWEKQLLEREPDETTAVLDVEALKPYKEKVKILEKELAVLDGFLDRHFDTETQLQISDFTELFGNLDTIAPPYIDSVAIALSADFLEKKLIYISNRLQYPPQVMREILTELERTGKNESLGQVFEYVKTLNLGIVENKKKVLWQLAKYIGIKRSAAIFEEQDLLKERAYPDFLEYLNQNLNPEDRKWLESDDPEADKTAKLVFNDWYEINKNKFLLSREKIRNEIGNIAERLDDETAYKIIEKHLATNPKEIFELFESQDRISSKKMPQNTKK